ncbi:MAG: FapA family protein [bacterium]|nr:FapA family protein [bacterium]
MKKAWDLDGHYRITIRPQGVFLTVYPPVGEGEKVNVEDVIREIEEKGLTSIDFDLINLATEEASSVPVKIGEGQAVELKEGKLIVEISEDKMSAYLTIVPPQGIRGFITLSDVKEELKKKGVVFGVDEQSITEMLENEDYNRPILVAQGKPPVSGSDAVINYRFKRERVFRPKELKDGRVDFRELGFIQNVKEGEVLATKIPPTKCTPGMTVTGQEILGKDGEDFSIPAGKNTEISEDGLELRATVSGQVIWSAGKVNVESVCEIKGDVGVQTGNIEFIGNIVIGGNIRDGYSVKATGDIEVKGSIEKAMVEAGGDIIVQNGILGRGGGKVTAGADIIAKFIENGNVEAKGDIFITEAIMHSQVDAGGRVVVYGGKRGVILGGRIRAKEGVNARTIGSWTETETEIEVGVSPASREEIRVLEKEIENDKKNFRELKLGIKTLLDMKESHGGNLPRDKEELLSQHLRAQKLLMVRLRDATEKITALQKELSHESGGKISVFNVIYPGVKICIHTTTLYLKREYKYVTFSVCAGKISVDSYEEPKLKRK